MPAAGLVWDLFARDKASPAFLRVAGAADKAAGATAKATASMEASMARVGKAGAVMTKRVTLPLAAIAAVSVAEATKYQKSLTTIAVVTDQTAKQMQDTSKGLMKVATDTGTSLGQLTEGLYTVEKGGFRGSKALDVLKAAAQGAKAENVDLATATGALTSVMASYGKALGDPVKAENEIIRGSGLAKTTMQDFAASLSNVVPVASSLHVSFADVAAAISTMTQHGETAQHATENLRNLITNLAGQNNVAAGAMSQLGINTVDLSKNLGKRGLVGSLDYVLGRVAKLDHGGTIVVSTFKRSAQAARSMNLELKTMDPALRKQSEGLLSGAVTIKEYQKGAKDLGGRAGASALQFLSLYKSSKGFSDLVKSGRGNVLTYATALQKMLGGVTGMNVALQLSGESAHRFHENAKLIGDAANATKGDVLGWAQTQGTLSVKLDKAKASLQVMAVEIGTALIPAVSKLADLGTKAAHWVDGLSGTQKKVLLWTAGILAGLGPILTLGSRLAIVGRGISTFAANAGQRIATLVGATSETATRVGNIARGMVRGLSGVLAGAAASQIGGNSSGGWLASVLLGTAGGWAMGGPIGAAVGGVSAAIFKGVGLWNDHKKAAKEAALQEKAFVDSLTQSINADNGALGTNLKLSITKSLQSKGILDQAEKLGVSLADTVAAAMGNKGALTKSIDNPASRLVSKLNADLAFEQKHPHMTETQAAPINAEIQSLNKQIGAYGKLRQAITGTSGDVQKATRQYDQEIHALNDSRVSAGRFSTQLAALRRTTTIGVDANGQLNESLARGNALGQHNRDTITNLAAAALADANNTFAAALRHHDYGNALNIATKALHGNIATLEAAAQKAGFNKKQTDALIASLRLYSGLKPAAQLRLNTGPARDDLNAFIASLPTITVNANVRARVGPGSSTYRSQVPARVKPATGGYITGPGTGTSDSIPAMVSNGEFVVNARQTAKHLSLLHAINSGVQGYAKGGTIGNVHYKNASDYQSALQNINQADAAMLAAGHNINASASELASAAKDLRNAAKDQKLSAAFQRQLGQDANRLVSLGRSRDSVRARLGSAPTAPTAYDRLATAQQNYGDAYSGVRSSVGAFDFTTAGVNPQVYSDVAAAPVSAGSILGQLRQAAAKAVKFGRLLKTLVKDGLPKDLVMQLAQAGPAAYDQAAALAAATPAEIAGIKSSYSSLVSAGGGAGSTVANAYYANGVAAAKALVKGLRSQESALNKEIRDLGDRLVSELEHKLGVKQSPSLKHPGKGDTTHIHVHGIDDPKTFARRVETEQARKALARVG